MSAEFDRWVSSTIREALETRYYAEVNRQADAETLCRDPDFMSCLTQGTTHVGLYSDHGVAHVRDVARQSLTVLDRVHGLLIPKRSPRRFALMQGLGVLLAYFHDIGMYDFSAFGRAMHPEFAAQAIFSREMDDIIDAMWQENSANLPWHLSNLAASGAISQPPLMVLRELLTLAMAHSKSKVPTATINNPALMRDKLRAVVTTDLRHLYELQFPKRALTEGDEAHYDQPRADVYPCVLADDSFSWLIAGHLETRQLVEDAIDTVRALRCADALRQRGTLLKTSGGSEVFISRETGAAVYALRLAGGKVLLLEGDELMSIGEASLAGCELDADGNLRVSFQRGEFATNEASTRVVEAAATVIDDIQQDAIGCFVRADGITLPAAMRSARELEILIEEPDDDPEFAERVRIELCARKPALLGRVRLVPSLRYAADHEREMYLKGSVPNWSRQTWQDVVTRLVAAGLPEGEIDLDKATADTRLVSLQPGEVLVRAGDAAGFVYIPLSPGLRVAPLGGYETAEIYPWTPVGVTGIVRGGVRNATVVADAPIQTLAFPKSSYLRYWHRTHTPESFRAAVADWLDLDHPAARLARRDRSLLLARIPLLNEADADDLMDLAASAEELELPPESVVFRKGDHGDGLYAVVTGSVRAHDEEQLIARFGAGDVFGEMATLTTELRAATVTTETDALLLRLPKAAFDAFLAAHGEVARGVIAVLAKRLREQTEKTAAGHSG